MEKRHDFWKDLDLAIKTLLDEYRVKYSDSTKTDDLLLDYLAVYNKLIPLVPRKVFISPVLEKQLANHPKQKEIEFIISLLKDGKNINFFQSETLFQSKRHDHLLNEWNIYHFHLSTERQKNSNFYGRTKAILFIYITGDKAILLDVKGHSRQGKSIFADQYWIEILHDHFPDDIKHLLHSFDMPQSGDNYSAEERMGLWEKGLTPFLYNIRGFTYGAPGIGRTTSGHAIQIIRQHNSIIRWVHYANEVFQIYQTEFMKRLNLTDWKLQLAITEHGFSIVEHNRKEIILVYPNVFDEFQIEN